jgi:hypothetical protein
MNALECIRSINTPSVEEFFNFIEEKIRGKWNECTLYYYWLSYCYILYTTELPVFLYCRFYHDFSAIYRVLHATFMNSIMFELTHTNYPFYLRIVHTKISLGGPPTRRNEISLGGPPSMTNLIPVELKVSRLLSDKES